MELRQLHTFVTIVNTLSFTRAANELSYAQSTVTSQIQALEQELSTILFDRLGRQIKLTRDGEQLYSYAVQILKLSTEATNLISNSLAPRGSIVIGTAESLCLHRLPPVFHTFRSLYPDVELKLNFDAGGEYRTFLRKNTLDIAIFLDVRCDEKDLVTHVLFEEPMAVIAEPHHPLAYKNQVTPQDLTNSPLVLTSPGCTYRRIFESILAQSGVKPSSIMGISSNEVIKRFVCDGWGIGFLPRMVVNQELVNNQLVELPWFGPAFQIEAQLIYHKEKWLSPAAQAFIEAILTTFRPSSGN